MSLYLDDATVFIALLLPYSDGSGEAAVLGVYATVAEAQARCWRASQRLGYDQPTGVIPRTIGADNLDDPPEDGSLAFECRESAKKWTEASA